MVLRLLRLSWVLSLGAFLSSGAIGCTPQIGKACTISTDCSALGERLCDATQPDGYCTIFNCEPDTCPNSVCVAFEPVVDSACGADQVSAPRFQRTFCMATCNSDSDCRSQYACLVPATLNAQIVDLTSAKKQTCSVDSDCPSKACTDGTCAQQVCVVRVGATSCTNGKQDKGETDVDCGGAIGAAACPRCAGGQRCATDPDCVSNACTGGTCERPAICGPEDAGADASWPPPISSGATGGGTGGAGGMTGTGGTSGAGGMTGTGGAHGTGGAGAH